MSLPGPAGGRSSRMARMSALVAGHAGGLGEAISPEHVVAVASQVVHADGAALSVSPDGEPRGTSVCALGELGRQLEELQFTLGEGPRTRSLATGGPVLVPDMTAPHVLEQWPIFAPAATLAGIRAHFAFPLQIGAIKIGVLEMCRRTPGLLSVEESADAVACADLALGLVLNEHADIGDGSIDWLAEAGAQDRAQVHQAAGMASVQLDVSLADALARLRAYAYAQDLPIGEVARRVVTRVLRFTPDHPGTATGGQTSHDS